PHGNLGHWLALLSNAVGAPLGACPLSRSFRWIHGLNSLTQRALLRRHDRTIIDAGQADRKSPANACSATPYNRVWFRGTCVMRASPWPHARMTMEKVGVSVP